MRKFVLRSTIRLLPAHAGVILFKAIADVWQ